MPPDPLDPAAVDRVASVLRGAGRVLFITGAGISADSGLPTYRGIGGLYDDGVEQWRHYAEALEPAAEILAPWIEAFGYKAT